MVTFMSSPFQQDKARLHSATKATDLLWHLAPRYCSSGQVSVIPILVPHQTCMWYVVWHVAREPSAYLQHQWSWISLTWEWDAPSMFQRSIVAMETSSDELSVPSMSHTLLTIFSLWTPLATINDLPIPQMISWRLSLSNDCCICIQFYCQELFLFNHTY